MKHLLSTFLLLFSSSLLLAQGNKLHGYYVTVEGDSVACEFSKNDFYEISNSLKVTESVSGIEMLLKPENCLGFGVKASKEYRTIKTKFNYTSMESQLSNWAVSNDTLLFMQILNENILSLYSFKTQQTGDVFFIGKTKGEATQLIDHSYYKPNGELVHNAYFINQIYNLTKDRKIPINNLLYNEYSLKRYIAKYNNLNIKSLKGLVNYNIGLGANYSLLHKVSSIGSFAEFGSNISPSVEFNLLMPVKSKKKTDFFNMGISFNALKLKKLEGATLFSQLRSFSTYNFFGFIGYKKGLNISENVKFYASLNGGVNTSFGGLTFNDKGEKTKMEDGDSYSGDFKLRPVSVRYFLATGLSFSKKIAAEVRFDRIHRYNFKSDNGGKSPLNSVGVFLFYNLN